MWRLRWSSAPVDATPVQKRNFINVQNDAVGIGLASAAAPFLPVFLTRLGASNVEVGLLTSMPALTGLLLGIFVGRFLQTRPQIVPWFSAARLLVVSSYALTGLATFLIPQAYLVRSILLIWAVATLPQTVLNVSFSVVMNSVAGPRHRYDLMSRRWSILGLTTAIAVGVIGLVLDRIVFPLNYQLVFIGLSLGGVISYYFSSHIELPDAEVPPRQAGLSLIERVRDFARLIRSQREFILFIVRRFVYHAGVALSTPIFPLYLVRVVQASDSWIGFVNTAQTALLLVGYFLWTRQSRVRGSRYVLLWATLGLSFYPALVSFTQRIELIALYAGLAGVFQAGIDLVFFDELMKTVPEKYSATFVSMAQSLQHFSLFVGPMLGTWLAGFMGLGGALLVSAALRFLGFAMFAWWKTGVTPFSPRLNENAAH